MSKKEVVITLSRTYSYNLDILDGKKNKEKINDAIDKAYLDFAEEASYFYNDPQNFVSHKTKIVENDIKGRKQSKGKPR